MLTDEEWRYILFPRELCPEDEQWLLIHWRILALHPEFWIDENGEFSSVDKRSIYADDLLIYPAL